MTLMIIGALVTATIAVRKRRQNQKRAKAAFAAGGGSSSTGSSAGAGGGGGANTTADTSQNTADDDEDDGDVNGDHTVVPLLNGDRSAAANVGRMSSSSPDRKVSFREEDSVVDCPQCRSYYQEQQLRVASLGRRRLHQPHTNGDLNGFGGGPSQAVIVPGTAGGGLPVERAVVRTFSIDKLRPICPTCNPEGETPYPSDSQALDELHQTAMEMLMNSAK